MKITAALAAVVGLTLLWGALYTLHITSGPAAELENRALAGMTGLMVIFVVHISIVGIVLGGNVALMVSRLGEKTERIGSGDLDVELDTEREDEIGNLYSSVDGMRTSLQEMLESLESERERAERAQREAERQRNQLLEEAERFSTVMDACADGDFTVRAETDADIEAVEEISASFNEMIEHLSAVVARSQSVARAVDRSSTELQTSAEEIQTSSETISDSIQEISDGSREQTDQLEHASAEINELSAATEEVASTATNMAKQSEATVEIVDRGQAELDEAVDEIRSSVETTETVVALIEELNDQAQQVEEVITFIDEIARQTSMLALNANIEASRGMDDGNGGEGFTAVAEEVKELSEKTQGAVDEIEETLESITERADRSARGIETVEHSIKNTESSIDSLQSALGDAREHVEQVDASIQEIDRTTSDQSASANDLAGIVQTVASVSAETTSQAENVAAASEEATATAEQVYDRAATLDGQAKELTDVLAHFEVEA